MNGNSASHFLRLRTNLGIPFPSSIRRLGSSIRQLVVGFSSSRIRGRLSRKCGVHNHAWLDAWRGSKEQLLQRSVNHHVR